MEPSPPSPAAREGTARDLAIALLAAVSAGALYVATLQPDFGGPEDTPKFQFVGYVLGIPHAPGYPLYVMLSHVFVTLVRIGTIAYRANLFSAVMAATACASVVLIARTMRSSRWAAFCAALGLAAGVSFWRSAVYAEVYSLAAAVAGISAALLLLWGVGQRTVLLLGAIAATAAAFGNHLTIAGVVPAYVAYVLWRNRRVITFRFAAVAALLIAMGIAQYGLLIVRTRQHAPYIETYVADAHGLIDVIFARRFADKRFNYTWSEVLTVQLPVVARTIAEDLGPAGTVLVLIGCVAAAVTAVRSRALLLLGAAAGMLLMIVNIGGDVRGFITPLMVFVWPFAAFGADAVGRVLRALPPGGGSHPGKKIGGVVAALAAAALPVWNVAANFRESDHSRETEFADTFRAMHQQLPDGAGVVIEDYFYDMALRYYQLTGEGGPNRLTAVQFGADAVQAAARPVYAFAGAATYLATEGLQFVPAPLRGLALETWLRSLPSGSVAMGATAYVPGPLDLSAIGHPNARAAGRAQNFETFAVVVRKKGEAWTRSQTASSVVVDSATLGAPLPVFPAPPRAIADRDGARVALGDRTIVRVPGGMALAVFNPDGSLARGLDLGSSEPWTAPPAASIYRYSAPNACATVTVGDWSDVSTPLSSGSAVTTMLETGSVVLTLIPDDPATVIGASGILGDAVASSTRAPERTGEPQEWRTELARTGGHRTVFRLTTDRPAGRVRARLESPARQPLTLCAYPPTPLFRDGGSSDAIRANFEHEAFFGPGWSGAQIADTGRVRLAGEKAALLLPLDPLYAYRLTMDLSGPAGGHAGIGVFGAAAGECAIVDGVPCAVDLRPERSDVTVVTLTTPSAAPGSVVFRGARIERQPRAASAPSSAR